MNVRFLTESMMSVKHLKSYIDKNCSSKDGWSTTNYASKFLLPENVLKNEFGVLGKESFYYPDGSPSDWFVKKDAFDRDVLFVFGISPYEDSCSCCVFVYTLFKERKEMFLEIRTFMRYTKTKLEEDKGKSATQLMKRVMARASAMKDARLASEFITKREWFK